MQAVTIANVFDKFSIEFFMPTLKWLLGNIISKCGLSIGYKHLALPSIIEWEIANECSKSEHGICQKFQEMYFSFLSTAYKRLKRKSLHRAINQVSVNTEKYNVQNEI